jgi:hypothetical protein
VKEAFIIHNRREFIKTGLRTIVLGSLGFAGLSLGKRRSSGSEEKTSCSIDLPCRICSKLPGCQEREALDAKQEYRDSLGRLVARQRGPK